MAFSSIFSRSLMVAAIAVFSASGAQAMDTDSIQVGQWNHMLVITAPAGDEDPGPAVRRRLAQRVTLDIHDQGIDTVADFLRSVTGLNLIVAPDVLAAPPSISLTVKDMPLNSVLKWVATLGKVHVGWQEGACYISSGAVPGPMKTTYHDVSDLVMEIPDFPGPEVNIPEPGGRGAMIQPPMMEERPRQSTEDVADLVRRLIAHQ